MSPILSAVISKGSMKKFVIVIISQLPYMHGNAPQGGGEKLLFFITSSSNLRLSTGERNEGLILCFSLSFVTLILNLAFV